jgi:hypothetical protein
MRFVEFLTGEVQHAWIRSSPGKSIPGQVVLGRFHIYEYGVNRDLSCKAGSFAHSYFLTLACVNGGGRGLNRGLSPEAILVNLE